MTAWAISGFGKDHTSGGHVQGGGQDQIMG
jgi:hypothetical protein